MSAKMRRHSVAVMSTSFLTQSSTSSTPLPNHHRTSPANGASSEDRKSSTGPRSVVSATSKARDGTGKTPSQSSSSSISVAPSSSSFALRSRRHSVAVHPGAVVSVMESGRQATASAAAASKKKQNPVTASDIIDDLITKADASLIRNCPLPTGSVALQAAILELDESNIDDE